LSTVGTTNAANRAYYACFQAAVAALLREDIRPGANAGWAHAFVQSQFAGTLINRRKRYAPDLRDTLPQNLMLRQRADYEEQRISQTQSQRALNRKRAFVDSIQEGGERL
jgi:uncharacterized protein (UPF0332 family)